MQLAGGPMQVIHVQWQQPHRGKGQTGQQQHLAADPWRPASGGRQTAAQAFSHRHRQHAGQHETQQIEGQRMRYTAHPAAPPGGEPGITVQAGTEAGHGQDEYDCRKQPQPTIKPDHGHCAQSPGKEWTTALSR